MAACYVRLNCGVGNLLGISRNLLSKENTTCLKYASRTFCSDSLHTNKSFVAQDRDPAPYFFNSNVQDILRRITGLNLEKIYSTEPRKHFEVPRYEFMTEEQLKKVLDEANKKAIKKLQMPPVLKKRQPIEKVLSNDPELKGFDSSKFVFVDVSPGLSDRKRTIVVREPDGILRTATWEERDRMNRVFYPVTKQKLGMPKMFLDENLERILNEEKYEFILDRACLQFEPDDPDYIRICHKVYDYIEKYQKYDALLSTRHYGPMVFYFAFYKTIDNILLYMIKKDRLDKGADVVRLHCAINPNCKMSKESTDESELSLVKKYTEMDSVTRSSLELAMQSYEDLQRQQQQYRHGILEAHGQA